MNNMENWNRLSTVPVTSLKPISFGALKGKSDINPQWRYKAMTEVYGSCGIEWSHRLVQQTIVDGANGEKLIYLEVAVKLKDGEDAVVANDVHVAVRKGYVPLRGGGGGGGRRWAHDAAGVVHLRAVETEGDGDLVACSNVFIADEGASVAEP